MHTGDSARTAGYSGGVSSAAKPSQGYDVARPHGVCAITGAAIEPDQTFMAALREIPQGFERVDVSLEAWPQFDQAGVLAFWQTVMPRPEHKKKLLIDDATLCSLFERLGETDEPGRLAFRFVLGLILMRKRLLNYQSTRHDAGRDVWLVRPRGQEAVLEMVDPHLDEQKIAEVTQQLGQIINDEL